MMDQSDAHTNSNEHGTISHQVARLSSTVVGLRLTRVRFSQEPLPCLCLRTLNHCITDMCIRSFRDQDTVQLFPPLKPWITREADTTSMRRSSHHGRCEDLEE